MARSTRYVPALNPIHVLPSGWRNIHWFRSADPGRTASSATQAATSSGYSLKG